MDIKLVRTIIMGVGIGIGVVDGILMVKWHPYHVGFLALGAAMYFGARYLIKVD